MLTKLNKALVGETANQCATKVIIILLLDYGLRG